MAKPFKEIEDALEDTPEIKKRFQTLTKKEKQLIKTMLKNLSERTELSLNVLAKKMKQHLPTDPNRITKFHFTAAILELWNDVEKTDKQRRDEFDEQLPDAVEETIDRNAAKKINTEPLISKQEIEKSSNKPPDKNEPASEYSEAHLFKPPRPSKPVIAAVGATVLGASGVAGAALFAALSKGIVITAALLATGTGVGAGIGLGIFALAILCHHANKQLSAKPPRGTYVQLD